MGCQDQGNENECFPYRARHQHVGRASRCRRPLRRPGRGRLDSGVRPRGDWHAPAERCAGRQSAAAGTGDRSDARRREPYASALTVRLQNSPSVLPVAEGKRFCLIRSHLQNAGFVMVKRCDGARAARFLGQAPHGPVTGGAQKEIGSASPTLSLWCSGWPPRPAWLPTVKSASVQSDLVLLLFLLLGGHDLVSLMNSRPKTPRLARPYYKHLVNEWKLNKQIRLKIAGIPGDAMAPSPAIPVGNLDNASALGELLHQRV